MLIGVVVGRLRMSQPWQVRLASLVIAGRTVHWHVMLTWIDRWHRGLVDRLGGLGLMNSVVGNGHWWLHVVHLGHLRPLTSGSLTQAVGYCWRLRGRRSDVLVLSSRRWSVVELVVNFELEAWWHDTAAQVLLNADRMLEHLK